MRSSRGFSLVEVAVALGVISFAILALLGLVVASHDTARESVDKTDNSLLFQKVVNQLRLKPFDQAQTGEQGKDDCYPLPSLKASSSVFVAEPFLVDEHYRYLGSASDRNKRSYAAKVVRVVVMDAPNLRVAEIKEPTTSSEGQLAAVRIEISGPPAAYREDLQSAPHQEVFETQINLTEQ